MKSIDLIMLDKSGGLSYKINYALNQESCLRAFLDDPIIPLDNNDTERSIRNFSVGKHSWLSMDLGAEPEQAPFESE